MSDTKKYVLFSPREWCEDNEGCPFETPACAVVDEPPSLVYSNMWNEYMAEVDNYKDISLCTETNFGITYKPFLFEDDYFQLPQLSAPDNPVRKEQGVYEIDEETAKLLEGIYIDGKSALNGIEEEIKLLLKKHIKVALMTNNSIAEVVKARGRMLTNDELMKDVM